MPWPDEIIYWGSQNATKNKIKQVLKNIETASFVFRILMVTMVTELPLHILSS